MFCHIHKEKLVPKTMYDALWTASQLIDLCTPCDTHFLAETSSLQPLEANIMASIPAKKRRQIHPICPTICSTSIKVWVVQKQQHDQ